MRKGFVTIAALAVISLPACEKPADESTPIANAPAPQATPDPATGPGPKPARTPLGGLSDEEVVASLAERDQAAFHETRKNPKVDARVALLALCYEHQRRGNHQEAARVLRRVVELFPGYGVDWEQLAAELAYFAPPKEVGTARKRAQELLQRENLEFAKAHPNPQPAPPVSDRQRLGVFMAQGNFAEASRLGGKLAENAYDDDFDLFTQVVEAKLLAGDAKGAVPVAERLLKRDPYGWQSNRLAALVFSRGGQAERGERMMTEIAKRYS